MTRTAKMIGALAAAALAALATGAGAVPQAAGDPTPAPPTERAAVASPETFVRSLYARYADDDADLNRPEWSDEAVYAPAVVALMARDRALHPDEIGYMDADWICQCQDFAGLRLTDLRMTASGPDRAEAQVAFAFEGGEARRLRLMLAATPVGWRVADVIAADGEALVAGLTAANAEAERAAAR